MGWLKDLQEYIDDKFLHKWVGRKEKTEVDNLLRQARDLRWRSKTQASDIPAPKRMIEKEKETKRRKNEMDLEQRNEEEMKEEAINEAIRLLTQAIYKGTKSQQADVLSELAGFYERINYWEEMVRSYKDCLELRCLRFWGIRQKDYNKLGEIQRTAFRRLIAISQGIGGISIIEELKQVIEKNEGLFSKDEDVKKDLIDWLKEPPPSLPEQPVEV